MNKNREITSAAAGVGEVRIKDFLDMIAPSVLKFNTDHYICGNTFRCVWALREYPTATDEQAILRHLGEKDGVTLRIYTRQVTPAEEKRIIHNAANKNRMNRANTNDLQQTVTAESNLQDVAALVATMHRNREPLLHCAVYIELTAHDFDQLKLLQTEVLTELVRSKLNVDRLLLRQQQGAACVMPSGRNVFGTQFERVLPASSVANLYPFNYSGKTDPGGFYIGRDKFGSNIIVDFDRRDDDKTNASILILGNSGQGKSYLLKLCLCNILESGKSVLCLDPEHEYVYMCETNEDYECVNSDHYHKSRYHCLNLHSVFTKGTVEYRLFNSDIQHAGKIKAYIQLSLAITAQALNQTCASRIKTQTSNEKYTFRTWLLRLGMIGDEFKTARTHLLEHLDGCIAWKDPTQAQAQKERLRQKREKAMQAPVPEAPEMEEVFEPEEAQNFGMTMSM